MTRDGHKEENKAITMRFVLFLLEIQFEVKLI